MYVIVISSVLGMLPDISVQRGAFLVSLGGKKTENKEVNSLNLQVHLVVIALAR